MQIFHLEGDYNSHFIGLQKATRSNGVCHIPLPNELLRRYPGWENSQQVLKESCVQLICKLG